jgi:hypothetical protein
MCASSAFLSNWNNGTAAGVAREAFLDQVFDVSVAVKADFVVETNEQ